MKNVKSDFANVSAVFINCSLQPSKEQSHTQKLIDKVAHIMQQQDVAVTNIYVLDHTVATGMVQDGTKELDAPTDDWPSLQQKIRQADIVVIGTPIWLGVKSSVCTQVIERMYAFSSEQNDKGQYANYGKVGGCIVTGNEDGIKHCAMDILYALQHIGFTIPPQADCGWVGEAGPGPSYGDTDYNGKALENPAGQNSEFTNRNATYMAWNLMHMARLLKNSNGLPALGNTADSWSHVTNASDPNPEYR